MTIPFDPESLFDSFCPWVSRRNGCEQDRAVFVETIGLDKRRPEVGEPSVFAVVAPPVRVLALKQIGLNRFAVSGGTTFPLPLVILPGR